MKKITPSSLELPAYLMNLPTSFTTEKPNNIWMKEMSSEELVVDEEIALAQWLDLYNLISSSAFVQILPTPSQYNLQDLVFVANMGIVLNHIEDREVVIISKFTSPPRFAETAVGETFFTAAGYEVHVCPYNFEGEAELKHIKDNIYIGGYGQRSTIAAYEWMEENFDMKIIKIHMKSEKLYHLDCMIFPITTNDIMVATKEITEEELAEIEAIGVNIIHVPTKYAELGATNNVRLYNLVLNSSEINDLDPIEDKEFYDAELAKNRFLEDICAGFAMEVAQVNLSEFMKGGALLSCCVMHLNRASYRVELI